MSDKKVSAAPVRLRAPRDGDLSRYEEVRLPLTEKELARERLRAKVDVLTEAASVRVQMQAEPVKMLGGASAVGAILGLALGSQIKRTQKVYVDANSPVQYQKRLIQAQKKEQGQDLGGAIFGTLVALGVRAVGSKLVRERLSAVADDLMAKANGEGGSQGGSARERRERANPAANRFARGGQQTSVDKLGQAAPYIGGDTIEGASTPPVSGGMSESVAANNGPVRNAEVPGSRVQEKAGGSPIQRDELQNPNQG